MAYASIADMVLRYGNNEIARASTPDGVDVGQIVPEPVVAALEDASAVIDGYLRKRYRVPLDVAPTEVQLACCRLARYSLSTGGERQPAEQTQKDQEATMRWLKDISLGHVLLDLQEVAVGQESFAAVHSRRDRLSDRADELGMYDGYGGGFWGGPI
jgi:phage gp36-like protein